VLVKRKYPPFKGEWVLPGGLVGLEETLEKAVQREVLEETGCKSKVTELIGVYSHPGRDPRGRTVSACFSCQAESAPLKESEEAVEVKAFRLEELPPKLGFDHLEMIKDWQKS
jgi:8-oxo-dGTP diphosphatase